MDGLNEAEYRRAIDRWFSRSVRFRALADSRNEVPAERHFSVRVEDLVDHGLGDEVGDDRERDFTGASSSCERLPEEAAP